MKYKLLGRSGLRVSELCLGTNTFGTEWKIGTDKGGSRQIFDAFAEAGGNFIDTANNYNHGTSEQFVGEFVQPHRDHFVIATKYSMQPDGQPAAAHVNGGGNQRKNMVRAVEESLRRLQTDYIDLLYLHAWDGHTPADEVMRAFDDLISAGKIMYVGISDTPAWVIGRMDLLAELRGWHRVAAVQLEYSLVARTPERELLPLVQHLGASMVSWYSLGAGVLTGKYNRDDLAKGRLKADSAYRDERSLRIAEEVSKVADEVDYSPAQVALNWVRQQHPSYIPIVGSSKVSQTRENLNCLNFQLSEAHLRRLNEVSAIELGFPHDFLNRESIRRAVKRDAVED